MNLNKLKMQAMRHWGMLYTAFVMISSRLDTGKEFVFISNTALKTGNTGTLKLQWVDFTFVQSWVVERVAQNTNFQKYV